MGMFQRRGMALVMVLAFTLTLLVLGSTYLKNFSNVKQTNPILLEQVQSDYLAQGLQKIAMLKFKKFPSDFYHAYLYSKAKTATYPALLPGPDPLDSFHGDAGTILQNLTGIASPSSFPLTGYNSSYRLLTNNAYNKDGLEVTVTIVTPAKTRQYKFTINATRIKL